MVFPIVILKMKRLFYNPDIVKTAKLKTITKSPFLGNKGILTVHYF